jgi:DNA-binding Lrp family transcriptional regulator
MFEIKVKSDNLPSLQKRIVLHLAEKGPQTINETSKGVSNSNNYRSTWTSFKTLEKKGLIIKFGVKSYRNNMYPRFWLSDGGIVTAMIEGVNSDKLLEKTKILRPDAKVVHCFVEIVQYLDPIMLKMAYSSVKNKGKLAFADVLAVLLSQMATQMDFETVRKLVDTLKNYPEEYVKLKILIQTVIDQLYQVIAD